MKKGFTLIELLVVIAIIGVLSAVVLASINIARTKGTNAAIKSSLANMRAQAEIFYDNNGGYSSTTMVSFPISGCDTTDSLFMDPVFINAYNSLASTSVEALPVCVLGGIDGGKATSWSVSDLLKGTTDSWCVDSTGASKIGVATASSTESLCI